jgi:hypothetical protein
MNSKIAKSIVFYPMMFMRPFAKIVLKFVGVLFIIGAVAGLFGDSLGISLYFFTLSFVCFLISWFYDIILLKINPQDTVLILS